MNETKSTRLHYVDNLRSLSILLLIPFHATMAFNCWGEANYIYYTDDAVVSSINSFLSPWYMPLLFVLAGISTAYSLKKRTPAVYVKERVHKLFLPLLSGMLLVVAPMTYYADKFHNHYTGSFLEHYQVFFRRFTDFTGYDGGFTPGHLWFLLYLFLISLLSLGVIQLQKRLVPKACIKGPGITGVLLLGLLPPLMHPLLNIGGKSLFYYLLFFLFGYYVFSKEQVIQQLATYRFQLLLLFLVADCLDVYLFIWRTNSNSTLNTIMMHITVWAGILTLLGYARVLLNQNTRFTRYLARRSFLFYIFHFVWLIQLEYYLTYVTSNRFMLLILPMAGAYALTFLTCEIIVRIPGIRFAFGVKATRKRVP